MKRVLLLLLIPVLAVAQRHGRNLSDWRLHEEEPTKRNFSVDPATAKLLVDNVNGFVHVTGYSGREVQVSVTRRIGADSSEAMAEAKRDVKLDMSQQGNYVRLYVDGPFRGNNGTNYRGDDYYGYRVLFDYEIQVPSQTELILKTISNGEIAVKKTTGDFEINGLNGGIQMEDIAGAGVVRTLNGPLSVSFAKNPTKNTEFRTLNGKMDVYFQPGLNADLNFRTLNGGIYTDFDVTTRPQKTAAGEISGGKFIYRSNNREMEVRTGSGGPELTFHALNGAIRLHSSKTF
jgi:hypothetical protein